MNSPDLILITEAASALSVDDKLLLIEHLARSLQQKSQLSHDQRQQALCKLREELDALPVCNPADGFSNRDHDRALYGS